MPSAASASGGNAPVTLFLSGDVMLGRGVDQVLPHPGDPRLEERYTKSALEYVAIAERAHGRIERPVDFPTLWGDALAELERVGPDARIVNLETSITTSDDFQPKGINYRMHPGNAAALTAAGIDCCVLANNHVLDFGRAGLVETLETLEKLGIGTAGAGRNAGEAARPAIVELGGGGRVIVFACGSQTSGIPRAWAAAASRPGVRLVEETTPREIADAVRAIRRPGDLVVASIHWGGNWGYAIAPEERALAHALVDEAGVDVVHGHSSHHPKAIEIHRGRPILYGAGDLLNDYEGIGGEKLDRDLGLLYFVTFDPQSGRLVRLEASPLRRRRFRLVRAPDADVDWLRSELDRESRKLGARVDRTREGRLRWRAV